MSTNSGFCNTGRNTGQTCTALFGVQNKFILVYTYNSAGVANEIDITATMDSTAVKALLNNADATVRWYPLPQLKNIKDLRADPMFKTWDGGQKAFIQQGIKSVEGYSDGRYASPQMEGKINGQQNLQLSYYAIDKFGNLRGKRGSSTTKLAPIQIEDQSLYAVYNTSVDKDIQMIKIGFDVATTEKDADMWVWNATLSATTGLCYNLNNAEGLYDVTAELVSITDSVLTVKLTTDGGDAANPFTEKGLLAVNFISSVTAATAKVRNITDSADDAVTVVEFPAGTYALSGTFGAAKTLQLAITNTGYDHTQALTLAIVTP